MRHGLSIVLLACSVSRAGGATDDDDPRCGMLDDSGHVRNGASYSWMIQGLVIESFPPPNPDTEAMTTIRFLLSSPLLAPLPALCQGVAHPPERDEFQSCTHYNGTPMEDPWLSFSYNFLLEGFAQMNQTWTCNGRERQYVSTSFFQMKR